MKIQLFFIILIFSMILAPGANTKRSFSEAYSYAGSGQAFASASAGAGAFAGAGAGSFAGSFAGPANFAGARTSTSVSSSSGGNQQSSSSSSSSSMRNVNGKTSYKIQTSVKTNDDPEIRTNIESNDINKRPKKEITIGGKKLKERHFKKNSDRKIYKLSVFFLKSLLRKLGYKKAFVRKCLTNRRPDVIKNAINIINQIGKHKKNYHDVGKLNGLCKRLNDIPLKLNNKAVLQKVKRFINNNM